MYGMAQSNAVLINSKSTVMAQLAQITAAISAIQDQIKTLSLSSATKTRQQYYLWRCGSNLSYGSKTCPTKKAEKKEKYYYEKILWGSKNWYEWCVGSIINKIKIITPKLSLINNIGTIPNSPINYTLAITDSDANIRISNKSTPTMFQVTMSNNIK